MPGSLPPLQRIPLRTAGAMLSLAGGLLALWLWHRGENLGALAALADTAVAAYACRLAFALPEPPPRVGTLTTLAASVLCVLALAYFAASALPWAHFVLMANFLLAHRRQAMKANGLLFAAMLAIPGVLLWPLNAGALAVAVLILLVGYRYASRAQGERARLLELATRDALTGLPNRRALERALQRLLEHGQDTSRYQHALLVLDLDNFKRINDRFGHTVGDNALVDLSMILRMELRELDQAFRYGGEEFVVIAKVHSREQLLRIAERLRIAIHRQLLGPDGALSVSIGAAVYAGESDWQAWFGRADAALYRSKQAGRNRSSVSGP